METTVFKLPERPGPIPRHFSDELHAQALPKFLARPRPRRTLIFIVTLLTLGVDYLTGPAIRFPAVYAVPILLAAWYESFAASLLIGVVCVGARLAMEGYLFAQVLWPFSNSLITAASSLVMIGVMSWFAALAGRVSRELRLLWGLIPMCMYCHKIRDEKNTWRKLETYLEERSQALFTHGICPGCMVTRKQLG